MAFLFKVGKYTYHHGNIQNSVYLWRIDICVNEQELVNRHYRIRNNLKQTIQVYHTRAMRKEFIDTVELYVGKVEKARMRYIYSTWLNDSAAPINSETRDVDDRVETMFELGDPDLITDFREINESRLPKYDIFWEYASKYLEGEAQESILAVDERRHDIFQHLAVAISTRDFRNQVLKICPPNIPIPSIQWIRLQFWPKNPTYRSSLQFTGKLPIKFMVQSRQLRCNHEDLHYASALFRYQKEMAILLQMNSWLVFMDDKHRCKVGEPGYPVAAVERGRQVIVSKNNAFKVADHDFTKCGIIPSVTMLCNIPATIEESFYRGQVYIGLKDPIFQPSDSLRHMAELYNILNSTNENKPYLFLYTDGGPDHRVTYVRVQLALIALFLKLDLDLLIAVRTPPGHSWKNPVERIMSILNLGMQCIGLMRSKMGDDLEDIMKKCNTMEEIRTRSNNEPQLKEELINSLQAPITLMKGIFERLSLKDESFMTYESATNEEIKNLWESLLEIEDSLEMDDRTRKDIKDKVSHFSIFILFYYLFHYLKINQ